MRTMHETVQFVTHYMYQKINEYRRSEISNLLNAAEVSRNLMRWKLHKYSKVYLSKVVWIKFMIISILHDVFSAGLDIISLTHETFSDISFALWEVFYKE